MQKNPPIHQCCPGVAFGEAIPDHFGTLSVSRRFRVGFKVFLIDFVNLPFSPASPTTSITINTPESFLPPRRNNIKSLISHLFLSLLILDFLTRIGSSENALVMPRDKMDSAATTSSNAREDDTWAPGSHQLLTEETLEYLARRLESDPTVHNRSATTIAEEDSGEESEDGSSHADSISSQERFNRKWGYVPPLDEETIRIIEAIIKNPARAETMVGIGPGHMEFLTGLHDRNVLSEPSTHPDPRKEKIQSLSLEGFLQETPEQESSHEELWKSDIAKCEPGSSAALYQRTLMINLIARHCLIYQSDGSKEQIFDFSVEQPWGCLPMPSRLLWDLPKGQESDAKLLTQPKPDLAVCFNREVVIADSMWGALPPPTKRLACFEDSSANASRVFHFLAVEAKRPTLDLGFPQTLHQCLNSASQALHNMFEFFRDAGPEHERVFYDKVRFFSIEATIKGIIVRIHRAIRKPDDAHRYELIMPDRPEYRLEFEFREFQRISGPDGFSREKVLEVVRKILKYATDDLLPMINAAASTLVERIHKDVALYHERRAVDFYSHGMPNPKSLRSPRRTSVVPSAIGNRTALWLDSTHAPLDQSSASGQTTPSQPHQPDIPSQQTITAKKRGADGLEDLGALDPPVRKLEGYPVRIVNRLYQAPAMLALPSEVSEVDELGTENPKAINGYAGASQLHTSLPLFPPALHIHTKRRLLLDITSPLAKNKHMHVL